MGIIKRLLLIFLLLGGVAYAADQAIPDRTLLDAAPAENDEFAIYDTTAAAGRSITVLRVMEALESPLTTFEIHADNLPAGVAADVNSVGDCLSGACFDGSSDGGTTITIYDGDSHSGQIDVPNISGNVVYTMPASTGTIARSLPKKIASFYLEVPAVEDLDETITDGQDFNVTRVYCSTDTGTVSINIENGADTNILSAELVCDSNGQSSCASGCDVNTIQAAQDDMAAYAVGNLSISALASSPTILRIHVYGTPDN